MYIIEVGGFVIISIIYGLIMFTNYRFSAVAKTVAKMFVAVFFSTFLAKKKNRKKKKRKKKKHNIDVVSIINVDKETFSSLENAFDTSLYIQAFIDFVYNIYMIYTIKKEARCLGVGYKIFCGKIKKLDDDIYTKSHELMHLADKYAKYADKLFWGNKLLLVLSSIISIIYIMAIISERGLSFFDPYLYYISVTVSSILFYVLRPLFIYLFLISGIFKFFHLRKGVGASFHYIDEEMETIVNKGLSWLILFPVFGEFLVRFVSIYLIKEHILKPFLH